MSGKRGAGSGMRRGPRAVCGSFAAPLPAILFSLLLLPACARRAAEPDPALVAALVDIHLLDARAAVTGRPGDSVRTALLRRHGFTDTTLRQALGRLVRHPEDYEATLAAVSERLSTRQRELPPPAATPPAMMPPAEASSGLPPP